MKEVVAAKFIVPESYTWAKGMLQESLVPIAWIRIVRLTSNNALRCSVRWKTEVIGKMNLSALPRENGQKIRMSNMNGNLGYLQLEMDLCWGVIAWFLGSNVGFSAALLFRLFLIPFIYTFFLSLFRSSLCLFLFSPCHSHQLGCQGVKRISTSSFLV
jgi:hypothetical protein